MERGGKHAEDRWLAFQFDFRPIHVGIFFTLCATLEEEQAARATFLIMDNEGDQVAVDNIKGMAVQCPAKLITRMRGHFSESDQVTLAWCEDLTLLGKQIAFRRQLHWLGPLATFWGNSTAASALRAADDFGRLARADPGAVFPHIFEKVVHPEALTVWQHDLLKIERHCPRPYDDTYAPSRYRETQGRGIEYLEIVQRPGEALGLAVQVCDVWKCFELDRWMTKHQRITNQPTNLGLETNFTVIGHIIRFLAGGKRGCSADTACAGGGGGHGTRGDSANVQGGSSGSGSRPPPAAPAAGAQPQGPPADRAESEEQPPPAPPIGTGQHRRRCMCMAGRSRCSIMSAHGRGAAARYRGCSHRLGPPGTSGLVCRCACDPCMGMLVDAAVEEPGPPGPRSSSRKCRCGGRKRRSAGVMKAGPPGHCRAGQGVRGPVCCFYPLKFQVLAAMTRTSAASEEEQSEAEPADYNLFYAFVAAWLLWTLLTVGVTWLCSRRAAWTARRPAPVSYPKATAAARGSAASASPSTGFRWDRVRNYAGGMAAEGPRNLGFPWGAFDDAGEDEGAAAAGGKGDKGRGAGRGRGKGGRGEDEGAAAAGGKGDKGRGAGRGRGKGGRGDPPPAAQ